MKIQLILIMDLMSLLSKIKSKPILKKLSWNLLLILKNRRTMMKKIRAKNVLKVILKILKVTIASVKRSRILNHPKKNKKK